MKEDLPENNKDKKKGERKTPDEVYLNQKFKKTSEALTVFKNDELIAEPGERKDVRCVPLFDIKTAFHSPSSAEVDVRISPFRHRPLLCRFGLHECGLRDL